MVRPSAVATPPGLACVDAPPAVPTPAGPSAAAPPTLDPSSGPSELRTPASRQGRLLRIGAVYGLGFFLVGYGFTISGDAEMSRGMLISLGVHALAYSAVAASLVTAMFHASPEGD